MRRHGKVRAVRWVRRERGAGWMRRAGRVGWGRWVAEVMSWGWVESWVRGVMLAVAVLCPWRSVPGRLACVWQALVGRRLVSGWRQRWLPVVLVPAGQGFWSVAMV